MVAFDKVEGAVSQLVESAVTGENAFSELEALESITEQDIENSLKLLKVENQALSVIVPSKEK